MTGEKLEQIPDRNDKQEPNSALAAEGQGLAFSPRAVQKALDQMKSTEPQAPLELHARKLQGTLGQARPKTIQAWWIIIALDGARITTIRMLMEIAENTNCIFPRITTNRVSIRFQSSTYCPEFLKLLLT
jgi:hypothetical protein